MSNNSCWKRFRRGSSNHPEPYAALSSAAGPNNEPLAPQPPSDEEEARHYSVRAAYGWLWRSLTRDGLVSMAAATTLIAVESVCANQPAVLLGSIVDVVGTIDASSDAQTAEEYAQVTAAVRPLFLWTAAALIGKEVATIARKYIVERSSTELQKSAFLEQARHLLAVRVDALQDRRVGDLAVRLDKSVHGLVKLQKITFMSGVPNIATAGVALWLTYSVCCVCG